MCPQPPAQSPEPRAGFSLIELLVVMAMMGVVMGALLTSFLIGRKSYLSADAYVQVQQEARRAFDVMVKELRESGWRATRVQPAPAAPVIAGGVTAGPGASLDFQIALGYDVGTTITGCPTSAICWGAQNGTGTPRYDWSVRYSVNGTRQLIREVFDAPPPAGGNVVQGTARVLANDVQTFQVSYTNSTVKTVAIQLAVQQTSQQLAGGSMSTTPAPLQTRVRLRN